MNETYYFHICGEAGVWIKGTGATAFAAAVKALGEKRTESFTNRTIQTPYMNGDKEVKWNESGVSNFVSKNGVVIASVTRLIDAATTLRAIPSEKRAETSRENGKKGGRPRKSK